MNSHIVRTYKLRFPLTAVHSGPLGTGESTSPQKTSARWVPTEQPSIVCPEPLWDGLRDHGQVLEHNTNAKETAETVPKGPETATAHSQAYIGEPCAMTVCFYLESGCHCETPHPGAPLQAPRLTGQLQK